MSHSMAADGDGRYDTLTYERTENHTHEKTGKTVSRVKTVEVAGDVFKQEGGLTGFRSPESSGVFFLHDDGTVEYDPHDTSRGTQEVGANGEIQRHD